MTSSHHYIAVSVWQKVDLAKVSGSTFWKGLFEVMHGFGLVVLVHCNKELNIFLHCRNQFPGQQGGFNGGEGFLGSCQKLPPKSSTFIADVLLEFF